MWRILLIVVLLVILSACGRKVSTTDVAQPQLPTAKFPVDGVNSYYPVQRFGPDEFGVVCYSRHADNLSCVQVQR